MKIIVTFHIMLLSAFGYSQGSFSKVFVHDENISQEGRQLAVAGNDIILGASRLCFDEEYYACSELYRINTFGEIISTEFIDEFAFGINESFHKSGDRILISGTNRKTNDSIFIRSYNYNIDLIEEAVFLKKEEHEGVINRGVTLVGDKFYLQNNAKYPGNQGPVVDNIFVIDAQSSNTDTIIEFFRIDWEDKIFDAQEDIDGMLSLLHYSHSPNNPREELFIVKIDQEQYSQEVIPLTTTYFENDIKNFLILPNGNYVYTQFKDSRINVVYCVDREGNPVWEYDLIGLGKEEEVLQEMTLADNGDILMCGFYRLLSPQWSQEDFDFEVDCGWLSRISQDGDLIWRHYYPEFYKDDPWPTSRYSYLYDVEEMPDGSIIATGMMSDYDEDGNRYKDDLWLLKVTADGCLESNDCDTEMQEIKVVSSVEDADKTLTEQVCYPNPASSALYINDKMNIESAGLYTLDGLLIEQMENTTYMIDISTLSDGLYLLLYMIDGVSRTRKVVVQH